MENLNYYFEKLELFQLPELSTFIINENFNHHCSGNLPVSYSDDVKAIYTEEKKFFDSSSIYVAKELLGDILGSIRILKWNCKDILPLQKIFNINPLEILSPDEKHLPIWHIGRFAIKKGVKDINLFKKLMIYAISPICESRSGIAFAECDSKLLRIMNLLGIKTKVIGNTINYLGSETIPVSMNYKGLIGFYMRYKSLAETELLCQGLDLNISLETESNNTSLKYAIY